MKKLILTIAILLISFNCYSQTGWIKSNLGDKSIRGVHFLNSNTGFLLCNDSLFKTTNSGLNWSGKGTGGGGTILTKLKVFDELNIAIMGVCCYPFFDNGLITRTSDGGNTWVDSYFSPNQLILNAEDMEWFDINTGISIWVDFSYSNYYGRIFRTTNSGINWNEIEFSIMMGYFISIKYQNADSLFALTNISLYKSTNQGSNWFQSSNLGVGYRTKYSCPSFDTMFFGGDKMFRSVNKGVDFTATFTLDTPFVVRDLEFINAKTGFAIGSSNAYGIIKGGYIIKTIDAGITWVKQTTNTNLFLRDIHFLNENTGWVVGDSGLILKTTTGGTTFINSIGTETPSTFSLSQNYPNPFNPTTKIRFDVINGFPVKTSGNDKVVLKVYDVMGREVQTLVNKSLKPGAYEVLFDGSALTSGVYFYKLITGSFIETKKMLLIK